MSDSTHVKHRCPRCADPASEILVSPHQKVIPKTGAGSLIHQWREAYRDAVIAGLTPHIREQHPDITDPAQYIRRNLGWEQGNPPQPAG